MRKFIEEFGAICLGLVVAVITIVIIGSVGGNVNDSATGIFNDFVSNSNMQDKDAVVYRIEYYSETGKSLGVGSVAAKKGDTKEVNPAKKNGYNTPASQTVKWDAENKVITFTYSPITYRIETELNGGRLSSGTNPTSYTIESNDIVLKNPSKSGHTFLGWKGTGIKDGEKNVVIKAGSTGDRKYAANFKIDSFSTTVIYETASGKRLNEEQITGDYGQTKTITAPEIKGYVKPKDVTVTFNNSIAKVVKMQYQPISYKIDISLIGGTLNNKPTSYTIESNDITLGTPTKQGFTFEGWTGINGINPEKNVTIKKGSTGDVYYVANWKGDAYILTFDARGGTLRPGDEYKTLSYNEKFGALPTPTKAEHSFLGWHTQPSGGNKVTPDNVITSKSVTVYAHWGANTYTANFDGNGGSDGASITLQAGQALGNLPTSTRDGYKFLGWYTSREGGNKISSTTVMPSGGATYYAHWGTDKNEYTVNHMTLNVDGQTYSTHKSEKFTANVGDTVTPKVLTIAGFRSPTVQSVKVGQNTVVTYKYDRIKYNFEVVRGNIEGFTSKSTPNGSYYHGATITLDGIVGSGYEFDSWNSNKSNITFERNKKTIKFEMPILDNELDTLTVYPLVNTGAYFIRYSLDGGYLSPDAPYSYSARVLPLTLTNPTKTGHKFLGWTGSNGNTIQKTVVVPEGSNGDKEYVAHWEKNTYTLTLNSNGGSVNPSYKTLYYGEYYGILPTPQRPGYKFDGWFTSATGGEKVSEMTVMSDKDVTIYAHWSSSNYVYNVIYKSTSGISLGSSTVTGTTGGVKEVYAPEKQGYNTPSSQTVVFDTPNKTIEFVYSPITYAIRYELNGGVNDYNNVSAYNIESSSITLQQPTKSGYEFLGWTGTNGKTPQKTVVISKGSYGERHYIANWKLIEAQKDFKIYYHSNIPGNDRVITQGVNAWEQITFKPANTFTNPNGTPFVHWAESPDGVGANYIPGTSLSYYWGQDLHLYAIWEKAEDQFTVTLNSNPDYGTTEGSGKYTKGTTVQIRAIPKTGNEFVRWSDGVTLNPRNIIVNSNIELTAEFKRTEPLQTYYNVNLSVNTSEGGYVTGSGRYLKGSTATIQAVANSGWEFVRWSDNIPYARRNITVNSDVNLTAEFRKKDAVQTVAIVYDDNWTGATSTQNVNMNSSIRISGANTFTRNGYKIKEWCTSRNGTGTCYVPGSTVYWTETVAIRLYAIWEANQVTPTYYTVSLYSNTSEGITEGSGRYQKGTTIQIEAIPNYGYEFVQWNDGNTSKVRSITVNSNISLTASFRKKATSQTYTINVNPYPSHNYGDVAIDGFYTTQGQANYGQTIELTALAKSGYDFIGWKTDLNGGFVSTSSPYRPTVYGNTTYYAIFEHHNEVATRDLVVGPQFNNVLTDLQVKTGKNITAIEFTDKSLPTSGTPFSGLDADNDNGVISNYSNYAGGIKVTVSSNKSGQKIYANKGSDKMFSNLEHVQYIDVSNLDTSNVTTMYFMFHNTGKAASAMAIYGLNNWDVSKVYDFGSIFFDFGHSAPNFTLDVSSWVIKDGANMYKMFGGAYRPDKLHLGMNAIATPRYIPTNVQHGDQVTSYSWFDASDNYKEYTYGLFPLGITSSHVLVRERPY